MANDERDYQKIYTLGELLKQGSVLEAQTQLHQEVLQDKETQMLLLMGRCENSNPKDIPTVFYTLGQGVDRVIITATPAVFTDENDKESLMPWEIGWGDAEDAPRFKYKTLLRYPVLTTKGFFSIDEESLLQKRDVETSQDLKHANFPFGSLLRSLSMGGNKQEVSYEYQTKDGATQLAFRSEEVRERAIKLSDEEILPVMTQIFDRLNEHLSKSIDSDQNTADKARQLNYPIEEKKKKRRFF